MIKLKSFREPDEIDERLRRVARHDEPPPLLRCQIRVEDLRRRTALVHKGGTGRAGQVGKGGSTLL